MDIENQIMQWLVAHVPYASLILMILGSLVVIGMVVVGLTPSTQDDAFVERLKNMPIVGRIILALASFSPIQKRPPQQ